MKIELEGMVFKAFHGCLESERREGNTFEVDFSCEAPFALKATKSDRLEDTVDYSEIYDLIAAEMAVPSDLLEHVAGRIVRSIATHFAQIGDFTVRVSKACPPVNGECRWSRVILKRTDLGI